MTICDTQPHLPRCLALWTVPQLLAIASITTRVRFSANYITPAEDWGVQLLVVVQFFLICTLAPVLLTSLWRTALLIVIGWLYMLLAGFLAATEFPRLGEVALLSGLSSLVMYAAITSWPRRQAETVAAALMMTFGSLLTRYLVAEFASGGKSSAAFDWLEATPLLATLQAVTHDEFNGWAYSGLIHLLLVGFSGKLIHWLRHRNETARGSI